MVTKPDNASTTCDDVCRAFDDRWEQGDSPRLEDFLTDLDEPLRAELFVRLLQRELIHRHRRGLPVSSAEYRQRFPGHQQQVDAVLLADTVPTLARREGILVRCPHCHDQTEILPDEPLREIVCSSCGSRFNLLSDTPTVTNHAGPNQRIAQFELLECLGSGGFGLVWKARDTTLDRLVACKIPRAQNLTDDDREKFFREARAAAQLRHDNIVRVYEVGRDGDTVFIISDYIDGLTLKDWLTGQRAGFRESAEIVRAVALALEHAHRQGVIHRDIKPENIMLDRQLKPLVMDFGLARREAGEVTMTVSGAIVGTPAYMPPEQAGGDGHAVDARSDVYSLGVVLFELLTGERPFRGNVRMLIQQVLHDPPPAPGKLNSAIPRDLQTICLKCLEKQPERRYQSAAELAEELQRFLTGHPIAARPVGRLERGWRWMKRNPAVSGLLSLVAVLLLVLSIGGPLLAWRESLLRASADSLTGQLQTSLQEESNAKNSAEQARQNLQTALGNETVAKGEEARQRKLAEEREAEALHRLHLSQVAQAQAHLGAGDLFSARRLLRSLPVDRRQWETDFLYRETQGTPLSLDGGGNNLTDMAVSPDGRQLLTGCSQGQLKFWDLRTGLEIRELRATSLYVTRVCYSPDGIHAAAGHSNLSNKGTIVIWNLRTGEPLRTLTGHMTIRALAFSPDGRQLASAGNREPVRIWDVQTGQVQRELKTDPKVVYQVAWAGEGRQLFTAGQGGTVRCWDPATGTELYSVSVGTWIIDHLELSPDGRRLACTHRNEILVLDAGSGRVLQTLKGHRGDVTALAFRPDGMFLACSTSDQRIKFWKLATGVEETPREEFAPLQGALTQLAFTPDGTRLIGLGGGAVKIWNRVFWRGNRSIHGNAALHGRCTLSSDGLRVARIGKEPELIDLIDSHTGKVQFTLAGHASTVRCLAFNPTGTRLVSGGVDKTARVWDARSGEQLLLLEGNSDEVASVAFSPDGSLIATGQVNGVVVLHDAATGQVQRILPRHPGWVHGLAFTPDGTRLIAGGDDHGHKFDEAVGVVKIWDVATGQELQSLPGHRECVWELTLNREGTRLLTVGGSPTSSDGTAILWDLTDPKACREILTLRGHTRCVWCGAFSPDGQRIATGALDSTIRLWDARTGSEILVLRGHTINVESIFFTPDRRLISGGGDSTVRVWDARPVTAVTRLARHNRRITAHALSPRGRYAVSADDAGTIRIHDVRNAAELLVIPSQQQGIHRAGFSPDELQVVTGSEGRDASLKIWNVQTGELIRSEPFTEGRFADLVAPPDPRFGQLQVANADVDLLLQRANPGYDPWEEDAGLREAWEPVWNKSGLETALESKDWFAARYHLRAMLQRNPQDERLKMQLEQAEQEWQKALKEPLQPVAPAPPPEPQVPENKAE